MRNPNSRNARGNSAEREQCWLRAHELATAGDGHSHVSIATCLFKKTAGNSSDCRSALGVHLLFWFANLEYGLI